jgi:hypothetical protein
MWSCALKRVIRIVLLLDCRTKKPRKVLLFSTDIFLSGREIDLTVQHRAEIVPMPFGAVIRSLVLDPGVGVQHGSQPGRCGLFSFGEVGQQVQVTGDLMIVPGPQDLLDAREVPVERRATDPSLVCDVGHGDVQGAMFVRQRCRGSHDGRAHLTAVRLDRLVPELRHGPSVQAAWGRTMRR